MLVVVDGGWYWLVVVEERVDVAVVEEFDPNAMIFVANKKTNS